MVLVFQVLFFAKMFSQYNKFMIAWYDLSVVSVTDGTMSQQYKDMQAHHINCAVTVFHLTHPVANMGYMDTSSFQWASLNPSKSFLDSAYKYDIKVILATPENTIFGGWDKDTIYQQTTYNSTKSQQGLAYWGSHPAMWGMVIKDEIYGQRDIDSCVPYANDDRVYNPNLLRWAVIPPAGGDLNHANYGQFIQNYINAVQPNILTHDNYPIMDDPYSSDTNVEWSNDLFFNLDAFAQKSATNNIPFVYVFSSVRNIRTSATTNYYDTLPNLVNSTSYFMYAGLFYGAKGLAHWNGYRFVNNYRYSPAYREFIKNTHKKILDNETLLLSLEFKSAYHKSFVSTIVPGNDSIPLQSAWSNFSSDTYANAIFNVSNPLIAMQGSTIDSLAVSFMTDKAANRYFWVFNKSLVSAEDIQLNLKSGSNVIDILSGEPCLPNNAVIHLEPAEAKLFKFITNYTVITDKRITENTTWNSKRIVYEKIIVEPSVVLTITDTILFCYNTQIIVESGAKLIIDGGILTSACEEELWGGIVVKNGDSGKGMVELKNGAIIENAEIGVSLGHVAFWGGGIVKADNVQFINNKWAVYFANYIERNNNNSPKNNGSYFNNCQFTLNSNANFTKSGTAQVELQDVYNVIFTTCTFTDYRQKSSIDDYTNGIYALGSRITVGKVPSSTTSLNKGTCTFSGFGRAIYIGNKNTNSSQIYFGEFTDNHVGIEAEGVGDVSISGCQFNIPAYSIYSIYPCGYYCESNIGLYLNKSFSYTVENNYFSGEETSKQGIGIVAMSGGTSNHSLKNNTFKDLCTGVFVTGRNSDNDQSQGLVFQCNSFKGNHRDISIAKNTPIRYVQSGEVTTTSATGNVFVPTVDWHIVKESSWGFDYLHLSLPNHTPSSIYDYNNNILRTPQSNDDCNGYHGYVGNAYYTWTGMPMTAEAKLYENNAEHETLCAVFEEKKSGSGDKPPIHWDNPNVIDIIGQLTTEVDGFTITINGNPPITDLEKQIVLYYELTNLKQQMDALCYSSLKIIANNEAGFDVNEYRKWIGRFNTIETEYLLAETYMMNENFLQAAEILEAMPSKFSELDVESHQNYLDYFAVLQEYSALGIGSEMPSHLVNELIRLSANTDLANIRANAMGKGYANDWAGTYYDPWADFTEMVPVCAPQNESWWSRKSMLGNNTSTQENGTPANPQIQIHPNPTTGELKIESEKWKIESVKVYDIVGQLLQSEIGQSNNTITINLSRFPSGLYFITVTDENQSKATKKVVKK